MPSSKNDPKNGKSSVPIAAQVDETRALAEKIKSARKDAGLIEQKKASEAHLTGHARAVRLGTEFIAAILVGTGIGFFADRIFGTAPWIMLVMVLVGFAAGVLTVVRSAADMNSAVIITPDMDLGPEVDDEDDNG
ncbi:AtpZ/AtpI family protein [Maritalea sp.]|uniref:AtpZ/AtpI family protein n=1 Tax=Maritalea sp. TaxID=2003361 RepID=UPI003EF64E3C